VAATIAIIEKDNLMLTITREAVSPRLR
jgi:hypothetical protein